MRGANADCSTPCSVPASGPRHLTVRIDESDGEKDASPFLYLRSRDAYHRMMLHVALVEPEIPPNTGNVARLCAATNTELHIVGVTGFRMDDRTLRRSGLDYWRYVRFYRHLDLDELYRSLPTSRFVYFSTKATTLYTDWKFQENDCLIFGPETRGLPNEVLNANRDHCLTIPMSNPNVRSLNLSTSVGIAVYEAVRQFTRTNEQPHE